MTHPTTYMTSSGVSTDMYGKPLSNQPKPIIHPFDCPLCGDPCERIETGPNGQPMCPFCVSDYGKGYCMVCDEYDSMHDLDTGQEWFQVCPTCLSVLGENR